MSSTSSTPSSILRDVPHWVQRRLGERGSLFRTCGWRLSPGAALKVGLGVVLGEALGEGCRDEIQLPILRRWGVLDRLVWWVYGAVDWK